MKSTWELAKEEAERSSERDPINRFFLALKLEDYYVNAILPDEVVRKTTYCPDEEG